MEKVASQGNHGPMNVRKTDLGDQGAIRNVFLVKAFIDSSELVSS